MKAHLFPLEIDLIIEKTERNSMLLLEFIEIKQQMLPGLKVKTETIYNHIGDITVFKCRVYIDGEYASKATYSQFVEYINDNQ
jgi:hypothetical protein